MRSEIFTTQRWNGWLGHLQANTLVGGATSRVHGQVLDFFLSVREWRHPWSVDLRRNGEQWEAQVKPGLVNAMDPLVPGVPSGEQGAGSEEAGSLEGPWIPLRSFREGMEGESALTKKFFEARGVHEDLSDRVRADALGNITLTQTVDTNPLPPRRLLACDLYLAKARATFRADVTVVDGSGTSGQAVDYSVTYDTRQLELKGTRARLQQAARFPEVQKPTLSDRLMGNFADEGEDRLNICSIYFLAPSEFEGPLDGSWEPFTRHDVFWNLKHGARVTPPSKPPAPIRFFSGLAGGFGDLLINQWLALDNALSAQIFNAVNNTAPEGRFSIA